MDKVKELAEQARAWVNDSNNIPSGADFNLYGNAYNQHYAELLIEEALSVVDMPRIERNEIRKHFGIAEEPMPVRDIGLVTTGDWTK
jgi:hypothetical protein